MADLPNKASDKDPQSPAKKVTLKVKGQDIEVTEEESIRLAQMGKDYSENTEALKEKEKTLQEREKRVAELEVIVDEMDANPKLKEGLNKAYSDLKSGKIAHSPTVGERNLKRLDKLIEEATDARERENLRETRLIIEEETKRYDEEVSQTKKELKEVKEKLQSLESATLTGIDDRLDTNLSRLEGIYSKELVDKYRKDITAAIYKYPHNIAWDKFEKVIYHFATRDEIKRALLDEAKREQEKELNRKKEGSDVGGDTFVAKTPIVKDKFGRVDHASIIQRAKERLGIK